MGDVLVLPRSQKKQEEKEVVGHHHSRGEGRRRNDDVPITRCYASRRKEVPETYRRRGMKEGLYPLRCRWLLFAGAHTHTLG